MSTDDSEASPDSRWQRLMTLFDELGDLDDAECTQRLARLKRDDPELAARLRAMLASDRAVDGVLDHPLRELTPTLHAVIDEAGPGTSAGQRIGHYRLLEPIGQGGMGEVWLAERADGEYQQQVALKLLKRGMDTDAIVRRFRQERSILARLAHRNIVRLIDGGASADGRPYYVMAHVEGDTITGHAKRHALDVRRRVALLAVVADAVAHAHAQLVVHRDLKPSNVLVDGGGTPHLLDFGIAKLLEDSSEATLTGTGVRVLSPAYASPEQIRGDAIGTASDVYALGVLLFELLTGTLPHQRRSRDPAVLASGLSRETGERASQALAGVPNVAALYGDSGDARQLSRQLAGDLDVIIAKAMHADPDRRYGTAAALADDLRRWLAGRAIAARPDSARYRFGKFVRRNRLGVLAASVVMLSLIAGLGLALWQAGIAREQAQRAERQAHRTEQVKAFLVDLFRQNDPARSHGESLTGEQMLERSHASLGSRFADDPETEGELRVAIAEIRDALADHELALEDVNRGIDLLQRSTEGRDQRLARAYLVRSGIYAYTDRHDDILADLQQAQTIVRNDPDADPDLVDTIDQSLASILRWTASLPEALALQQAVLARSAARYGENDERVAEHRLVLALMLEDTGDFAGAEAAYRASLPVLELRRQAGPDPFLTRAHSTFAGLLDRIGKHEESAVYFERALAAQAQLHGTDSDHYARTLFSRGILKLSQRQFEQAEQDFRHVMQVLGEEGSYGGHGNRYLGLALLGQARAHEAVTLFERAETIYRQTNAPGDIQRWRARADRGEALLITGDIASARVAVETALASLREHVADDDVHLIRPLTTLGMVARAEGDIGEALEHHQLALAIAIEQVGPRSPNALTVGHQLVLDLAAEGSPGLLDEAEALTQQLLDDARASDSPLIALVQDLPATVQDARRRAPPAEPTGRE